MTGLGAFLLPMHTTAAEAAERVFIRNGRIRVSRSAAREFDLIP